MWPFKANIETIQTKDLQPMETKSTTLPLGMSETLFNYLLYGGNKVSASKAMDFYRSNATLATAVDMIGDACEEIDLVLKVGEDYVVDHELINLLYNPNGFNSKKQFFGKMFRFWCLTHNSYLLALGNYKFPPSELHSINPVNISVNANPDGYPDHYMITNSISDGRYIRTPEPRTVTRFTREQMAELYHIMGFSSDYNEIMGDSPLNAVFGEIRQLIQGNLHNLKSITNGFRPSIHFDFGDAPNPKQIAERKAKIKEELQGAENAGEPIVTGSGTDTQQGKVTVTPLSETNKDMDFAELQVRSDLAIYNKYKIPLPLVTLEASTFNNIHNAILFFYQSTVLPTFNTIAQDLTQFLIPKYKDLARNGAVLTYNPENIDVLMSKRLEELKKRVELGVETVNEIRLQLPRREELADGDVLVKPVKNPSIQMDSGESGVIK